MGLFDNNIHMNGAGTSYQTFLDLANAAEANDAKLGNRTVRLVKNGDGIATTTFHGTKGARVDQIGDARQVFLNAIAREFGYAARSIAEKTLGNGAGQEPVPLTARTIRAVNQALGDKAALAAESEVVRTNKMDFEIEVVSVRSDLAPRMGTTDAELDRERIQAEVLKLIRAGTYANDKDGMRAAIREGAALRVAVAVRMESILRDQGVPERLVRQLAATVLDEAVAVVEDRSVPDGDGVSRKLADLALKGIANGRGLLQRDAVAEATASAGAKFLADALGENILEDRDAAKAVEDLRSALDELKGKDLGPDEFQAECDKALDLHVRTYVVRQFGAYMMRSDNDVPAYGRLGVRLYDAFGCDPKDRGVSDFAIWKTEPGKIAYHYDLGGKSPEELSGVAARIVFQAVAVDSAKLVPSPPNAHPHLDTARNAAAHKVAIDLADRFGTAATDEDLAKLAQDFKTRFARQLEQTDTTLRNIDQAQDQAKAELEGRLRELADRHGVPLTPGIRKMLSDILADARDKLRLDAPSADKALSAEECKAAFVDRVEKKWLSLCRQAAVEIEASPLEPAQKSAFLAKVMEGKVNVTHVRMALRTVPAFDAGALAGAAKSGDGGKLAEELFRFIAATNAKITDPDEFKTIKESEEYSSFMAAATELLLILNPGIGDGTRGLDAEPRTKMFVDGGNFADAKSREVQNQNRAAGDVDQIKAAMDAKHWMTATASLIQLHRTVA